MNRIKSLFQKKKDHILNIYFTAGFPQLNDTVSVLQSLEQAGADMVEIGMPFSDPLADGETIQKSSEVALQNGMTIKVLFEQLKDIRQKVKLPIILMGYLNPVLQFGVEQFCQKCQETGIDGIILPDLPVHEYEEEYKPVFEKYGLYNIFLITPQTSEARIRKIDSLSEGFIYMVSSASTTGAKSGMTDEQEAYFKRIQAMNLNTPRLIGFGISDNATFSKACQYTEGAIIGSAFIKHIQQSKALEQDITGFVKSIRSTSSTVVL